jgi:hypothetical protein
MDPTGGGDGCSDVRNEQIASIAYQNVSHCDTRKVNMLYLHPESFR